MKKWKKLSSKIILDHPRLKVLEDMVELPNGKVTDYLRFENKGKAVTIICKNNGSIAIISNLISQIFQPDLLINNRAIGKIRLKI